MLVMTNGERLRALREKKGLTQEQLALLAGVRQSVVSKIERGVIDPRFSTMQALARALGMRLDKLEGDEEG